MKLHTALQKAREKQKTTGNTVWVNVEPDGKTYRLSPTPLDTDYHYYRVGSYGPEYVRNEEPESAQTHYSGKWLELHYLLDAISHAKYDHRKRFDADNTNHGYPGDLGAVNEKLREVLGQLGG